MGQGTAYTSTVQTQISRINKPNVANIPCGGCYVSKTMHALYERPGNMYTFSYERGNIQSRVVYLIQSVKSHRLCHYTLKEKLEVVEKAKVVWTTWREQVDGEGMAE